MRGSVRSVAWNRRALHRTPGNIALAAGFTIDADHLHTCTQHSGNWYAAHERLLTVVQEILRAAGLRTKRHYVASSRGRRCGDLEVRDANVADKAHLILDVAFCNARILRRIRALQKARRIRALQVSEDSGIASVSEDSGIARVLEDSIHNNRGFLVFGGFGP